ncbi:ArsA family ATPase [Tessaracoccus oleiagri]|uniref:Arsenite-transporting ATPase n=1 Tax=Tessaracoccus oleiagri TaxID=686624 RepID=A0A1G9IC72_9ACTN|nr:ArsA family ATPase [Tessaracoccus oleiagri]SDL22858.1 arsenite-transporting ATPase [Tessaracoccus oleiagri]
MLLNAVAGHRVLFVGGKGGVGKTSVSSALGHALMRRGRRVLLVSTDPAHNLGHLWERKVGDDPTRLASSPDGGLIDGVEIDPKTVVERHFDAVLLQMERMLPERLHGPAKRHLEGARHAPGSHESAMLERIAEATELGLRDYDVVIFDTAPSGHTLRLLMLPEQLTDWAETLLRSRARSEQFSAVLESIVPHKEQPPTDRDAALRRTLIRRRERFARLRDVLHDDAAFVLVTLAEPMPMAESLELALHLDEIGVTLAAVVINRRSPGDAGEVLAERRRLEDVQVERLRAVLASVPTVELPLLRGHPSGEAGVDALAQQLD